MTTAYLGIGSNVNAEANIRTAMTALGNSFGTLQVSPIYRSRSVGFDGNDFINLVVAFDTELAATDVRMLLRKLEDQHGRTRDVPKFSDRTLDVDILLFGEEVSNNDLLPLPRPEILRFAHVLKPLSDLAPGLRYPGREKTLAELWDAMTVDEAALEEISGVFLLGD